MTKDLNEFPVKKSYWNTLRLNLLTWFLALSLLPLSLTSIIEYNHTKENAINLAASEIEQSSHLTKKFISNWFYYRYKDIEIQAKQHSNKELLRKYQQGWEQSELPLSEFIASEQWSEITQNNQTDLKSLKQSLDYIYNIFLIDLSGNILFSLVKKSSLGENLFSENSHTTKFSSAVEQALKHNKTVFSGLERYEPSNNMVTGFLTAPITDKNNQAIGVIAIQLSLDRIVNSFKNTNTNKRPINHYLVNNDGILQTPINQNWKDVLNKKIDTKQIEQWQKYQSTNKENNVSTTSIYKGLSSRVIGTSQSIQVGNITWGLISEMEESNILVSSYFVFYNILISIFFTLIILIVISFFVTKRLTNPIAALVKASKEFSQGKVHKISPNQSSNEINQLIYSFNTMLDLRHSHEQQLEKTTSNFQKTLELLEEQKYALDQHSLVTITDIKGTITFANQKFSQTSGYSLKELVGNNHRILNSGVHNIDFWRDMFKTVLSGETWRKEVCNKSKDGSLYWMDTTIIPFMEQSEKPQSYIAIRTDITNKKQTEIALAKSEAASRGIFNSVADGIISLDTQGIITAINPAGEKIFNYKSKQVIGQHFTLLTPPTYKRSYTKIFEAIKAPNKVSLLNKEIELKGLRSDASEFILELSISEVKVNNQHTYTATMSDVTERKYTESQREQQHKLINIKFNIAEVFAEQLSMEKRSIKAFNFIMTLDFLKDILFSGVFILETDEQTLTNNNEYLKWYSKTTLTNNEQYELERITKQCINRSESKRVFEKNINNAKYHHTVPIFSTRSASTALGVLIFSAVKPIKNFNKNLHILNEIGDIFSSSILQNKARHLLKKASQIAEQNSHLKSEFLASMSHEIRTPMNGVLGMLGLLLNSNLNKDQKDKAQLAKSSAESLLLLINDILDFSKVEAGKLTLELIDFDLRKMLGDFCDSMALNAQEKGIELILDVTNVEQSMVKGDSGRIRQILTNLVSNAIKFTPMGEILISVSTTTNINQKLNLSCSIQDTGIGIPENKIPILFDKFTQVDASTTREFGGTGLGLAITKKLCLLMNGDITVKSTLGDGSQFNFTLLLDSSEQSTQILPTFNINQLKILIVDDNSTNRKILNRQLTHWGATVIEAINADEALNICQQYYDKHSNDIFDIALLDMQMPEMNGADLGKILQEKFKEMKLVMMTSITTENETQYFYDIGFSGFFTKPATTTDLLDVLAIMAENSTTLKETPSLITHEYIQSLEHSKKSSLTQLSTYTWPKETRLLIVEDNRINQQVALGILKEFNLTADIAGNGLEAITAINTAPEHYPYTLLLMDCQMPEMDGYDATKIIRSGKAGQKNTEVTIIAMTANAMEGDKEKCINAGMNDYVSKPIEPDQLIKKIQYWLIESQGLKISEFVSQNIESPINSELAAVEAYSQNNENNTTSERVVWDIETALNRVRDNKKLLAKLVSLYLEDMPGHIKDLQQSLQDKNIKIAKLNAHSIRGASGNLYAYKMEDLAKSIEMHITDNIDSVNFEELILMASSFDKEFVSIQKHFNAFVNNT